MFVVRPRGVFESLVLFPDSHPCAGFRCDPVRATSGRVCEGSRRTSATGLVLLLSRRATAGVVPAGCAEVLRLGRVPVVSLATGRGARSSEGARLRRASCLARSAFSLCETSRFMPEPEASFFDRSSFILAAMGASGGLTASLAGTLTTYCLGLVVVLDLSGAPAAGRAFSINFCASEFLRFSLRVRGRILVNLSLTFSSTPEVLNLKPLLRPEPVCFSLSHSS